MAGTHEGYDGLLAVDPAHDVFIKTGSGAPTDAVTGAGICGPGSTYIDYTNAKEYINTNTKTSPLWTVKGAQTT